MNERDRCVASGVVDGVRPGTRRVAVLGSALLGAGVLLFLVTARPAIGMAARVVEAEEFVLKDNSGAVRMRMGTDAKGNATVELFGKGATRGALAFTVDEAGQATAFMRDKSGGEVFRLAPAESGGADLLLISPEKQQGLFLSFKRGYPCVFLVGDGGKTRIAMTVRGGDDAAIELRDGNESSRIALAARHGADCKILALAKDDLFEFPASGKPDDSGK